MGAGRHVAHSAFQHRAFRLRKAVLDSPSTDHGWTRACLGSTNDLDTPQSQRAVLDAMLGAVPSSPAVQLRYPADLFALSGIEMEPLTEETAWTGMPVARTGHHNDCFLANDRDRGTYPWPREPDEYEVVLSQLTQFVPMGGETCAVDSRPAGATAAIRCLDWPAEVRLPVEQEELFGEEFTGGAL